MYKPVPLRQTGPRKTAWAGNLLFALLVLALVALVEVLPDLLAGWLF